MAVWHRRMSNDPQTSELWVALWKEPRQAKGVAKGKQVKHRAKIPASPTAGDFLFLCAVSVYIYVYVNSIDTLCAHACDMCACAELSRSLVTRVSGVSAFPPFNVLSQSCRG